MEMIFNQQILCEMLEFSHKGCFENYFHSKPIDFLVEVG